MRTLAASRACEYRVPPSVPRSLTTIDLATKLARASTTSHGSMPSPAATASAALASKVPEKTPRRAKTRCSVGEHRENDQSTVARSVWCRSTAERRPPVRSRKRSSSRAAISAGLMATIRAAASSIASGTPSSRRQISSTASAFAGEIVNDGLTDPARSANNVVASERPCRPRPDASGTESGPSGHTCSPATPRRSRLVARIRSCGHDNTRASANRPAPSSRCSQLSRMMSSLVSLMWSMTDSLGREVRSDVGADRGGHDVREVVNGCCRA